MKRGNILRFVKIGLAFTSLFMLAISLSLIATQQAYAVRTLKYAHNENPDSNLGQASTQIAEIIKERTKGEIIIRVYHAGQLGTVNEVLDGLKTGTIEMGRGGDFAGYARFVEDFGVFNLPYLYSSPEQAGRVLRPGFWVFDKLVGMLREKAKMVAIGTLYQGRRHLTCNKPIKTPDDLKGMKIRAIPNAVWIALVEGMGAIPTPVDWSEVPTALATGVVMGQENPVDNIYTAKLYEAQKYLMLTGHMLNSTINIVNEDVWKSLTKGQQEIFVSAVDEARAATVKRAIEKESEYIAKLKELKMTVIGPQEGLNVEAFKSRVQAHCETKFPQWREYAAALRTGK